MAGPRSVLASLHDRGLKLSRRHAGVRPCHCLDSFCDPRRLELLSRARNAFYSGQDHPFFFHSLLSRVGFPVRPCVLSALLQKAVG